MTQRKGLAVLVYVTYCIRERVCRLAVVCHTVRELDTAFPKGDRRN